MIRFILCLLITGPYAFSHEHGAHKQGALSLDSFANGNDAHLLWTSSEGAKKELRYLRSADGGATWSAPVLVPANSVHAASRGYFPQIAAFKNNITVIWTETAPTPYGGGRIQTAFSTDGGKTWTRGQSPLDSNKIKAAAFLDLEADDQGWMHAVWLDSREKTQGLHYARSKDFGKTWEKNVSINSKTCECCWNRIYAYKNHLQTLYRAYDPRDMNIAESKDSGSTWTSLSVAGDFGWKIKGCPHMGGAMARAGTSPNESLFSFVWTGKADATGMYVLRSNDTGKTWSDATQVGTRAANQGDIAASEKTVALVWRDDEAKSEVIKLQYSTDSGKTWRSANLFESFAGRPSYPQIHAVGDHFLVTFLSENNGRAEWRSKVWRPD